MDEHLIKKEQWRGNSVIHRSFLQHNGLTSLLRTINFTVSRVVWQARPGQCAHPNLRGSVELDLTSLCMWPINGLLSSPTVIDSNPKNYKMNL